MCQGLKVAVVFAGVRSAAAGADLERAATLRGCAAGSLRPLPLDVTSDDSVDAAVETVKKALSESGEGLLLAGIVNNAGISHRMPADAIDVVRAKEVYEVNVFGVMRVTTGFLPLLAKHGGRIVNTGSVAGLVGLPRWVPYSDTKRALESMTDSWRRELMPDGISVSILEPGFVKSELCTRPICKGDPSETTTPAFVHALTAGRPRARYAVASAGALPASAASWLFRALPDRILDAVLVSFGSYD